MKDIGDSHAKAPDEFQPFKGGLLFETTMKQTAVEWLQSELKKLPMVDVTEVFQQALAMEKEQMFELWNGGINCTEEGGKSFDQYYNETYKPNKS